MNITLKVFLLALIVGIVIGGLLGLFTEWSVYLIGSITGAAFVLSGRLFSKLFPRQFKITSGLSQKDFEEIIELANARISKMRTFIFKMPDKKMAKRIESISITSRKIIDVLVREPSKTPEARAFLEHYLPTTIQTLTRYDEINKNKLEDEESINFKNNLESLLAELDTGFVGVLESLFAKDITDGNADMHVLRAVMEERGLTESPESKEDK